MFILEHMNIDSRVALVDSLLWSGHSCLVLGGDMYVALVLELLWVDE